MKKILMALPLFALLMMTSVFALSSTSIQATGGNVAYVDGLSISKIAISDFSAWTSDNRASLNPKTAIVQGKGTLVIQGKTVSDKDFRLSLNLKLSELYSSSWYLNVFTTATGSYSVQGSLPRPVSIQVQYVYYPASKSVYVYGWGDVNFGVYNMAVK